MDLAMWISVFRASIALGTPILFAGLGEILSQRSGVMNLGIEGMMLVGAVSGFVTTLHTGSLWMGVLVALLAGALMGAIHACLTVSLRANQIVSGLALTIFGLGMSGYIGKPIIGIRATQVFRPIRLGILAEIPVLGPVLFHQDLLVYISFVLAPLLFLFIRYTRQGLHLRAVGENPASADAMGVRVNLTRYVYVTLGGALAGLGGAYLSLAYAPTWLDNMTAGRGWIAFALVILSLWNPLIAMAGAYFFGGIDALGMRLQATGTALPTFLLSMMPYLLTVAALTAFTNKKTRSLGPSSLGVGYSREE